MGCTAIPALLFCTIMAVVLLSYAGKMPVMILLALFFIGLGLYVGLTVAYINIPVLKIAPEKISFRRIYSKNFTELPFNEIKNFEFVLNRATTLGFTTQESLIIKVRLKNGGTKKFTVTNHEDPETIARTLNYHLLRANALFGPEN